MSTVVQCDACGRTERHSGGLVPEHWSTVRADGGRAMMVDGGFCRVRHACSPVCLASVLEGLTKEAEKRAKKVSWGK